jgi:hypothetical protein
MSRATAASTPQTPDRRVDEGDAMRLAIGGDRVGGVGVDGAHVQHQRALAGRRQHPAAPGDHLRHDGRIGQHGDDDVGARRDIRHRRARVSPEIDQGVHSFGVHVVNDKLEALGAQVRGHGAPHAPQPDETDLFH